MRTKEEIDRQINGLKSMKNWLPEYNGFGDNNWEKIDMQVAILDGSEDFDDLEEDTDKLDEGKPDDVYNAAMEANDWLDGAITDDLFEVRG